MHLILLSVQEVLSLYPDISTVELILRGFMPELHDEGKDATSYYRNYFRTYVERALRQLAQIKNLTVFEHFMVLLSGRVG